MSNLDDAAADLEVALANSRVKGYIRRLRGKTVQVKGYDRNSGRDSSFDSTIQVALKDQWKTEGPKKIKKDASEIAATQSDEQLRTNIPAIEAQEDGTGYWKGLADELRRILEERSKAALSVGAAEDAMIVELAGLVDVRQYFRRSKSGKTINVRSHKRHIKGSLLKQGDIVKDAYGTQKTVAGVQTTGAASKVYFKDGTSGNGNQSFEMVQEASTATPSTPEAPKAATNPAVPRSRASQRTGRDASALQRAGFPGATGSKTPAGSTRGFSTGDELTDEEYLAHTKHIEEEISKAMAAGKATDKQFAVDVNSGVWDYDRTLLHKQIADAMWDAGAANVPNDGKAMISGGLGGAGKSTVLKLIPGAEKGNYFTINSDDVKEHIANNFPDMIPEAGDLSPLERVALIHEESSHIADLLAARAYAEKKNMIWDITMASTKSVQKRISDLRANGYTDVKGVFVDIDVETSVSRALARHRRGMEDYRKGKGQGGRYVPPHIIRLNKSDRSSSANRETFDTLKDQFDSWDLYNNNVDGRAPVKEGSGTKPSTTSYTARPGLDNPRPYQSESFTPRPNSQSGVGGPVRQPAPTRGVRPGSNVQSIVTGSYSTPEQATAEALRLTNVTGIRHFSRYDAVSDRFVVYHDA